MESIRKIIPFEVWQSEWLLRWLHEQSREGWELTEIHRNTATFKPTTHINLTYGFVSDAANTKDDTAELEKLGPYLRTQKIREKYEADGWSFVSRCDDILVMRRTRFDAAPLPPIPEVLSKQKKSNRSQSIGTLFTLFCLILTMYVKRITYPHTLWLIFMGLMILAFAGGLLYLPHILTKKEEEIRPRDVSQEDYHRHLQHAKTLFLLKSAVYAGNIIGLAAQIIDIFVGISS